MTDKIVVISTCANVEEAESIARALLAKRLAACVNIIPGVRSMYCWKDAVEDASEILILIKSSRAKFDELRLELEKMHSYEVPEVIALAIVDGAGPYLDWLDRGLSRGQE